MLQRVRSRWRTAHLLPRELDVRRAALLKGARKGARMKGLAPQLGTASAVALAAPGRVEHGAEANAQFVAAAEASAAAELRAAAGDADAVAARGRTPCVSRDRASEGDHRAWRPSPTRQSSPTPLARHA
jgi:hypothetical protein